MAAFWFSANSIEIVFQISFRINIELFAKFSTQLTSPFFAKSGWTNDDDAFETLPRFKFSQDQSSLDRFAQTNFVGNEQTAISRFEEFKKWFVLKCFEENPLRPERVDGVLIALIDSL